MNVFFLILFAGLAAVLAAGLLTVLLWKESAVYFRSIRRRLAKGLEPLADRARLERSARQLNRAVLYFEAA